MHYYYDEMVKIKKRYIDTIPQGAGERPTLDPRTVDAKRGERAVSD